ncbi:MAG: hypothetical protein KDI60_18395, partial [Xanthomonadales bacterium]|nr:hypothetical protein [Xanthomonadales bacterium]
METLIHFFDIVISEWHLAEGARARGHEGTTKQELAETALTCPRALLPSCPRQSQHAAAHLIAFDGLEQGLEVALAEAFIA